MLTGMAGFAGITAVALAGCDNGGSDGGTGGGQGGGGSGGATDSGTTAADSSPLASGDEVRGWLQDLVDDTGLDTFQLVIVDEFGATVQLLADDGGDVTYRYDGAWDDGEHEEQTVLTSPSSLPLAELPLEHLGDFVGLIDGDNPAVRIIVDTAGVLSVVGTASGDFRAGMMPDGSGLVPQLDIETPDGVTAAIAEMVASYGTSVAAVGSFNGFVHIDANVDGVPFGLRITRYPEAAGEARTHDTELYAEDSLFDPSDFDPTLALEKMSSIMDEAELKGEVWHWRYSRPPQGGEPMVSYGVGESGPDQQIWINADGSIAEIVDGDCEPGAGFCPA